MADEADRLSNYIVSFASAARDAQKAMSSGDQPMSIKEYRFKINITADFEAKDDGDLTMNVWRISLKDKLLTDYKESMGIEVDCTMVPAPFALEGPGTD